ncbi:unnamed protein product [Rotaria socialis]
MHIGKKDTKTRTKFWLLNSEYVVYVSSSGFKGEKDQKKSNQGPIPEGKYTIANGCGDAHQRCNLTPDSSNNMFGRSAFQIHGDNGKGDQSASHGCIILNQGDRAGLKKDDKITVKK